MRAHIRVALLILSIFCSHKISLIETSTPNDLQSEEIRTPFIKIGHKYYLVEAVKELNWFAAVQDCRKKGTYLATIESADEMNAISAYLVSKGWSHWFWTSGNDLIKEGDWRWLSTGKKMIFTNWDNGQPDNGFAGEHCMNLWPSGNGFKWNDNTCRNRCRYICESRTPIPFLFKDNKNF